MQIEVTKVKTESVRSPTIRDSTCKKLVGGWVYVAAGKRSATYALASTRLLAIAKARILARLSHYSQEGICVYMQIPTENLPR